MPKQAEQQRREPRIVAQQPSRMPSQGGANGPAGGKLAHLAAMLNDGATRQLAPKQKLLQRAANHGGLPENVRNGIEALSGLSLGHVRVHYNSSRPAQLNAHAYAQGSDIHVAPGQEHHLPHEAWHVVQQAQGRVRPTLHMQQGVSVNDDRHLEREADVMGARALRMAPSPEAPAQLASTGTGVVQRAVPQNTGLPKPAPETYHYQAQVSAKNTMFVKANYPRSAFSFGTNTRAGVLSQSHFEPTGLGNLPNTVMTVSGHQANTQSVQLDHNPRSWADISDTMEEHNADLHQTHPYNRDTFYSVWDARMYYNDITNLRPAMGSDNASGGADGAHVAAPMHEGIRTSMATAFQSVTELQNVLGAYQESFTEDDVSHVGNALLDISGQANELSQWLKTLGER